VPPLFTVQSFTFQAVPGPSAGSRELLFDRGRPGVRPTITSSLPCTNHRQSMPRQVVMSSRNRWGLPPGQERFGEDAAPAGQVVRSGARLPRHETTAQSGVDPLEGCRIADRLVGHARRAGRGRSRPGALRRPPASAGRRLPSRRHILSRRKAARRPNAVLSSAMRMPGECSSGLNTTGPSFRVGSARMKRNPCRSPGCPWGANRAESPHFRIAREVNAATD
jgi:hypothetical protein